MRTLGSVTQNIGGDGAQATEGAYIDGSSIVVDVKLTYPIAKAMQPVLNIADNLIDKLEALIPGDQTALATSLKAEAQAELVKLLSETPA